MAAKMIGNTHMVDAGGKKCSCCYMAPKHRVKANRAAKRGKAGKAWKADSE